MSSILYLISISCTSLPISERKKSFIILNTKDTIYGDHIAGTKRFSNLGWVVVKNGQGENSQEKKYKYDQIYQVHYYDRKNRKVVQEIVEEDPTYRDTHQEMDIIINQGKMRLYLHDPGFRPDLPFVVSDIYYGYANGFRHKKVLKAMDKCQAFREKFTERKQRRKKELKKLIMYYNAHCE
ncbi:hypothetical protein [Kordia sp.]|uniref:hypothetical protein n=1 Tax=Kordia sp. TaxID=1965332 RepID=UPI003B5AB30A